MCFESYTYAEEYLTAFSDDFRPKWELNREMMGRKTNTKYGDKFPTWDKWEHWQVRRLNEHCGELMTRFGYGEEPEWQERLK